MFSKWDLSINFIINIFYAVWVNIWHTRRGSVKDEIRLGRHRLPIQITQKTYVLFIGSCQPASMCCKTHFFSSCGLGNSSLNYQFMRCMAEAGLGMVLPPYLVLGLGNAPFLNYLFITNSESKQRRLHFRLSLAWLYLSPGQVPAVNGSYFSPVNTASAHMPISAFV